MVKHLIHATGDDKKDWRIQASALEILRTAAEAYLVGWMQDSNLLAIHGGRTTIMVKDFELLKTLRGRHESIWNEEFSSAFGAFKKNYRS